MTLPKSKVIFYLFYIYILMTRILRVKSKEELPLATDLEERTIVAVGWMPGELLLPYQKDRVAKTEQIRSYLRGKRFRKSKSSLLEDDINRRFKPVPKLVEIVGALAEGCVLTTAHYFLEAGSQVYLNPHLTIHSNSGFPSYWIGRMFLQELLSQDNSRRCAIYKEHFLFYRERTN